MCFFVFYALKIPKTNNFCNSILIKPFQYVNGFIKFPGETFDLIPSNEASATAKDRDNTVTVPITKIT